LCQDKSRNPKQICVVEEPADRAAVEASGSFRGLYHVLGGTLAPIDGIGPEDLRIAELEARVRDKGAEEVVIATNPTAEGDATAHFLADRLRSTGVRLTRIASGMPLGGDLEYADRVTVGRSFDYRRDIE
jgi:recombination protein RecR